MKMMGYELDIEAIDMLSSTHMNQPFAQINHILKYRLSLGRENFKKYNLILNPLINISKYFIKNSTVSPYELLIWEYGFTSFN